MKVLKIAEDHNKAFAQQVRPLQHDVAQLQQVHSCPDAGQATLWQVTQLPAAWRCSGLKQLVHSSP
jgi:hypothetical protein